MPDPFILSDEDPLRPPTQPTLRGGDGTSLGRIDHYDLVRRLGGGGFGVVYLARDTVSGVEVAIKTLHPLLKHNAEEMDLLREKFRLVHGLTHPNIAKALVIHLVREINVWDDDARAELKLSPGDSVMVMDYAPGVTLDLWRRQFEKGIAPLDKVVEIARQVAVALDYAHSEKVLHRDVSPRNIMVETLPGGALRVRVLDFGLASEIRSSLSRVSGDRGGTSGTRPYMAPEVWRGRKQDHRTDQYSFACVLYEALTGAPPFAGVFETGDPAVMMATVEKHAPEPISGLSRGANAALLRALAKDTAARFPSCTAFVKALSTAAKRPSRIGLLAATLGLLVVSASLFAWLNSMSSKRVSVPLGGGVTLEMVSCPGIRPGYYMGKYEVTQEQWQRVMGNNPSNFKDEKKPVENVSWNECQAFLEKLNALPDARNSGLVFFLPEESDWRAACRAGAPISSDYCKLGFWTIISAATLGRVARYGNNDGPIAVGSLEPNAWGLYDMHGNVWEWTKSSVGGDRVICGGSFDQKAHECTVGFQNRKEPRFRSGYLGVRLAATCMTAEPSAKP